MHFRSNVFKRQTSKGGLCPERIKNEANKAEKANENILDYFKLKKMINVSVTSFCFIWVGYLWYGCRTIKICLSSFSALTVYRRLNLTSTDARNETFFVNKINGMDRIQL